MIDPMQKSDFKSQVKDILVPKIEQMIKNEEDHIKFLNGWLRTNTDPALEKKMEMMHKDATLSLNRLRVGLLQYRKFAGME